MVVGLVVIFGCFCVGCIGVMDIFFVLIEIVFLVCFLIVGLEVGLLEVLVVDEFEVV